MPLETDPVVADDLLTVNMTESIPQILDKFGPGRWVEHPRLITGVDGHRGWYGAFLPDAAASA